MLYQLTAYIHGVKILKFAYLALTSVKLFDRHLNNKKYIFLLFNNYNHLLTFTLGFVLIFATDPD